MLLRTKERSDALLAKRHEHRSVAGLLANATVRALELDLRRDEQNEMHLRGGPLPPKRRSPVRHKSDAVAVLDELAEPRDLRPLVPVGRIHPDQAGPIVS